jgi:DNA transformation protein and related proteins
MDDEALRELFSGLGRISIRKMFGGKGIYHEGVIVGLVLSTGDVFLKGDATSAPDLEAAGAQRWSYDDGKGRRANMPYWSIPESALDDPEELAGWTRGAYEAALRSRR